MKDVEIKVGNWVDEETGCPGKELKHQASSMNFLVSSPVTSLNNETRTQGMKLGSKLTQTAHHAMTRAPPKHLQLPLYSSKTSHKRQRRALSPPINPTNPFQRVLPKHLKYQKSRTGQIFKNARRNKPTLQPDKTNKCLPGADQKREKTV